jgi:hypothetical protein
MAPPLLVLAVVLALSSETRSYMTTLANLTRAMADWGSGKRDDVILELVMLPVSMFLIWSKNPHSNRLE